MSRTQIFIVPLLILTHCAQTLTPTTTIENERDVDQNVSSHELFVQGVALAKRGQLIRAEQYLNLAIHGGYSEEQALPILLKICLSSSRLRTALNYAEPYLIRHPESWMLRYLVASIYLALGQTLRAHDELIRVVQHQSSNAPATYLLAIIARDSFHDIDAATRYFAAYTEISPNGEHALEAAAWLNEHSTANTQSIRKEERRDIIEYGGQL
jgi:predicted Zn-dependent protease